MLGFFIRNAIIQNIRDNDKEITGLTGQRHLNTEFTVFE